MKAIEIKFDEAGRNISMLATVPARGHYKQNMMIGRVLPTTKSQAQYFVNNGWLDVLCGGDVKNIEKIMNKFGKEGEYHYTKSSKFVRLENDDVFCDCLKKLYNF